MMIEMNFEEDEVMSMEINLSCTLFDEILDTIYTRIYEYSFARFISDTKNRKLVNNTLKSIHKQRKRRKNGRNNTLRHTQSQSNNSASCSQARDTSVKDKSSYKHHNKSNSQGSLIKHSESNSKNYSSHTRSIHNHKINPSYSSNHHNNHINDNTIDEENNNNKNNYNYNNDGSILYDTTNNGKLFVIGNDNQLSSQTTFDIINKDNKSLNTINNIHNDIPIVDDQVNAFNTYPLNNSNNKGKSPFDTIESSYSRMTTNNKININSISTNNNNAGSSSNNINNTNIKNYNYNNENQKKVQEQIYENERYEYHDDLSVFWESEDENEENISIHDSVSEEELVSPQLRDERTSDLFKKNMESFRQKLLGSSGRDRRSSGNSTNSNNINNNNGNNINLNSINNNGNYPYFSNLVTSVKRRSSNLSNILFNHQNRENNNAIELKTLDAYNFS
eukprot:jgi/Orpsp1_1/1177935/evm.model.c7180000063407.1